MTAFSFLHLSDLHWGRQQQTEYWPNIRKAIHARLDELRAHVGQWDLVLFTGDLVDKGEHFEAMHSKVVGPLIEDLGRAQSSPPILLAVPGNHDLRRPADSAAAMFEGLSQRTRNAILDADTAQAAVLRSAFAEYEAWFDKHITKQAGVSIHRGPLPGDFVATLKRGPHALGIAGINTAFLQLSADNFEGRLAIHARQFQDATGGDGVAWSERHQVRLLLTHHPPSWLGEEDANTLRIEILAGASFDAHLCGHLHVNHPSHVGMPGARDQRTYPAASLFGREHYGKGRAQRRHGMTVGRIEVNEQGAQLRLWPLRAKELPNRGWELVPDEDAGLKLQDDGATPPIDLSRPAVARITSARETFFDLEDLLYGVVKDAKVAVDADAASIFLYDKDIDRYVLRESTEMTPSIGRASLDPETDVEAERCGMTAYAAFDDQVVLVDDVRMHSKWTKYGVAPEMLDGERALEHCELQPADLRSMIIVPFKGGAMDRRPAGVLRVARSRLKLPFTEEHKAELLRLLNETAPKIAGALSLTRLIAMGSILERDALCGQAVDLVLNMVRGKGCSIYLLDDEASSDEQSVYRCSATTGLKGKVGENIGLATYTLPDDKATTFTGYVAATRRNVVVDDVNNASFQEQYELERRAGSGKHRERHAVAGTDDRTGACMLAPLLFREQFDSKTPALGVIRVTKPAADPPFDPGEQRRFFMFADRLSQTLRQVRYMELLRRLSIAGRREFDYCAQEVPRLLGGHGCSIFLVTDQTLTMLATHGNLAPKLRRKEIAPYRLGTAADGFPNEPSFTVQALSGDVLWNDRDELKKLTESGLAGSGRGECEVDDHPPHRFLATRIPDPITRKAMGVIRIPKSAKECPFTTTDVRMLQSVADHLGIALHRAGP